MTNNPCGGKGGESGELKERDIFQILGSHVKLVQLKGNKKTLTFFNCHCRRIRFFTLHNQFTFLTSAGAAI